MDLQEVRRMNLDQYRKPVAMSDAGQHATRLEGLPSSTPDALAKTVQGLMIH